MLNLFKMRLFWISLMFLVSVKGQQKNKIVFCQKDPQCTFLNDHNFQQQFIALNEKLNEAESIYIKSLILREQNMVKLFSHQLPNIKSIDFYASLTQSLKPSYSMEKSLTPKIIQTIFQSAYFQRLQILDLQQTNLDYRHFSFLQNWDQNKKINLKNLTLSENYLQKRAFKYLQKMNFDNNLISLNLIFSSLVQNDTINSIIKMIKSDKNKPSSLVNISVYASSISGQNLIKIIQVLEIQKLECLNIGYNSLHQSKKYSIPFNNTFYQYLSNKNLSSLIKLGLDSLDLDQSHLQILQKLALPSLQTLIISSNFLNDEYFQKWITYQNMPRLTDLDISFNSISDKAIHLLSKQNFEFQILVLDDNKNLHNSIEPLIKFKTHKLKSLNISSRFASERVWQQFFTTANLEKLQYLKISQTTNLKKLFYYLNQSTAKNLKILHLDNVDVRESFEQIVQKNIRIQSLEEVKFQQVTFQNQPLIEFINNLSEFVPSLKVVTFLGNQCFNVSKINIQNLPDGVHLSFQCMALRKLQAKPKFQMIALNLGYRFLQSNIDKSQCIQQKIPQNLCWNTLFNNSKNFAKQVIENVSKLISFINIQRIILSIPQSSLLLKSLIVYQANLSSEAIIRQSQLFLSISKQNVSQNQNQIQVYNQKLKTLSEIQTEVYFPYLKKLQCLSKNMKLDGQPIFFFYLTKVESPQLSLLHIAEQKLQQNFQLYSFLFKKFTNLQKILLPMCSINSKTFQGIFNQIKLNFLKFATFQYNHIESSDMAKFLSRHKMIRTLKLSQNFIQKNMFDALSSNDIILQQLVCSQVRIGNQQFQKLAYVNTQFMMRINMNLIGINSQGLKSFLIKKQQINQIFFPKLLDIFIQGNFFQSEALKALLDTGIPNLGIISQVGSGSKNFINDILQYTTKISSLRAFRDYVYAIDPDLDYRSTRHLTSLIVQADDLITNDYKNLARLNLQRLNLVILQIKQVSECQILKQILTICKNVIIAQIYIRNQIYTLNDDCFTEQDVKTYQATQLKQAIVVPPFKPIFVPKFIKALFAQNQEILSLIIPLTYIGDQAFKEILNRSFLGKTAFIYIHYCQLTDDSLSALFMQNLTNIRELSLAYNQFTSKGLMPIISRNIQKFQKLEYLFFQSTFIGDKGLQILACVQYPELKQVYFSNIQITLKGLFTIFSFKAPKMSYFRITNNYITEQEFMEFIESQVYFSYTNLNAIVTNIRVSSKNMQKILKKLQMNKRQNIDIKVQVYYLQTINAANIT